MPELIHELLDERARVHGDRPALRWKRGGAWHTATWSEYRRDVRRVARALIALGVEPGQGVVIMSYNRPEWFLADLGAIHAGAVPTGLYTNSLPEQVGYVAAHCEAVVAVLENERYLELFDGLRSRLPRLRTVVVMEGAGGRPGTLSWEEFVARGDAVPDSAVDERLAPIRPRDLCTLIYTSGTTGNPKGVMICHHNLTWVGGVTSPMLGLGPDDLFISYLPLSHIAEQCVSLYFPLAAGCCTAFAESLEKLPENLREVRPTFFFGVPRVWEKIQARMQAVGAAASPLRRRIAAWARRQGLAAGYAAQRGLRPPLLHGLARRLVFDKVRLALGLDRTKHTISSAAPIALSTLEYFLSLGIAVRDVFGMSEVSGPATMSLPGDLRTGRAGYAIPGSELRIAADGELQVRGPHVFLGYYKDPAATREALDENGWLHTGDIGELDADGYLRITDRKKELLITSGGKNVAPAPIEARLRAIPGVAQAMLAGERQRFVAALFTLDPERLAEVAVKIGSPSRNLAAACSDPLFRSYLEEEVEKVNRELDRFETVRRFTILPGELTVAGGELTPTMKLRRRVVTEKYAAEIAALYAEGDGGAVSPA